MFVPRTLRDFGDLVMYFNEKKLSIRVDSDQQSVEVGASRVQWDVRDPYVHVTQPIAADIPADRAAIVASAVAQTNHAAQLPVLDFDQGAGIVSFRVTMVALVDGIRVDLLEAVLAGAEVRVRELREVLRDVLDHGTFGPP